MIRGERAAAASALIIAASLILTGCSAGASAPAGSGDPAASAATEDVSTHPVRLTGGWAKAGDGMTGVFGTLENRGDQDLVLTSVESPAAGMIQLHETSASGASATMREVEDGFAIPAGGSFALEPGGDHIMFMDLAEPLLAGDEVPLELRFDDGSTLEVSVLVKDFAGAQENYDGGDEPAAGETTGHDADGHDAADHDAAGHDHGSER